MEGKTVCMVSGGIDSPVASAIVGEKMDIVPLHFVLHPYYCEETFALTVRALRRLRRVSNFDEMVLFPFGSVLQKTFEGLEERDRREYSCVLCRRSMFRAASLICDRINASSIVTGESLGQKASQTLENLESTSWALDHPILRPLMGMDKQEIVEKSKEIGLYMPKHAGCCNMTPDNPRTKTEPEEVSGLFEELNLQETLEKAARDVEVIDLEGRDLYTVFHEYMKEMLTE